MNKFSLVVLAALMVLILFAVDIANATDTVEISAVGKNYEYDGWSNEQYPLINLFGEEYIPLFINNENGWNYRIDKLSKLILDSDTNYTLRTGDKIDIGKGYTLEAKQFDASGNKVWLEFSKDNQYIDDKIIDVSGASAKTWTVSLDDVQNETNIVVMKVHVNQIVSDDSGNTVQIDGAWLIDYANAMTLKTDDKLGAFKLVEINGDKLVFEYMDDQTAPNEMKIPTNDSRKAYPSIYENKIVWADTREGLGIYMYDLSASTETKITTNDSWNDAPVIDKDRIVWQRNSIGSWNNGDIYLYNFTTSKETRITNDSSNQQDPAIYGNRIVWTDWRNDKGNWSNADIYLYDLSTSREIQITDNESDQSTPAIYKDRIVWSDMRNGNSDIYMYDLSTSKETQITNFKSEKWDPAIYEDKIVWVDDRNGNSDIYMYDLSTSKETQITTNEADQSSPAIYGNIIVWEDERNGILNEFGRIENDDIYMYDLSTSSENRITTSTADQVEPFIYEDRIVFIDKPSGYAITNRSSEIHVFTISGEETGSKKPTADFSSNVSEGYAPLSIQFTDVSENSTGRNWDFENDGKVDFTDKIPVHEYTVPGEHTVKLIAFNANGTDSKITTVTVMEQSVIPAASFSSNVSSGTAPLSVLFTDSSTGSPSGWEWNFGDGTNSTQQNPTHTYSTEGNYTVSLTAINAAGNNTTTKSDYIRVKEAVQKPIANFSSNVTEGNVPLSVQFTDNSILNELKNPASQTQQVVTKADNGTSISLNEGENFTLKLRENPTTGYSWQLNLGEGLSVLNDEYTQDPAPEGYTGVPGTHSWIIKAVAQGNHQVNGIYKRPWESTTGTEDNFTLNVNSISSNTISRTWDFGDGENSTQINPMHIYSKAGNYTVSLTVNNSAGSNKTTKSDYIKVTEDVQKPVADFYSPQADPANDYGESLPSPVTVSFFDNSTGSPTSWFWDFGDGNTSTVKNPTHTYVEEGGYTVTLTVKNDVGSDMASKYGYVITGMGIAVHPGNFSSNVVSGSAPLKVKFQDYSTDVIFRYWTFGDGTSFYDEVDDNEFTASPYATHTYTKAGKYTVMLKVAGHGGDSIITKYHYINVTETKTPIASFTANVTSGKAPLVVKFTDTSTGFPNSWEWSFGDGTYSTSENPIHKYIKGGRYTVRLTVKNDDGSNTAKKISYINAEKNIGSVFNLPIFSTSQKSPSKIRFIENFAGLYKARN